MIQKRTKMGSINFVILIFSLFLTSCAIRVHKKVKPEPKVSESKEQQDLSVTSKYRLGFGDVIEVKFFNNDKFNETLMVRPDGRISRQKVGDILAAGLTLNQLSNLIIKVYASILKHPEVTVIVRNFGGYQVYML